MNQNDKERVDDRKLTWPDRICYLLVFAILLGLAFLGGKP